MSFKPFHIARLGAVLSLATLSGCVSIPAQFEGSFPSLGPEEVAEADIGRVIRWGGMILEARTTQTETCFEILSRELTSSMRPSQHGGTKGRFIACKGGFHDPEVFSRGREVTLTGAIEKIDVRKVGEFDYRYPIIAAHFITMWPARENVVVYEHDWLFTPYYWPLSYRYPYYAYPPPYPHPHSRGKGPRIDIP